MDSLELQPAPQPRSAQLRDPRARLERRLALALIFPRKRTYRLDAASGVSNSLWMFSSSLPSASLNRTNPYADSCRINMLSEWAGWVKRVGRD